MSRKNKGEGAGGSGTKTGASFEECVFNFLESHFPAPAFETRHIEEELKPNANSDMAIKILKDGKLKAILGNQNTIFKWLNVKVNYEKLGKEFMPSARLKAVWTKDLRPDIVLLELLPSPRVHVFEIKYQKTSGSVDEKIQTAVYKKEMWYKLFKQIFDKETDITYTYFLSNWFLQDSKRNKKEKYMYNDTYEFLGKHLIPFYMNQEKDYFMNKEHKNKKGEKDPKNEFFDHASTFKDVKNIKFSIDKYIK